MKTEKCKICGTEIERKGPGCKPKYCDVCRAERRRASQRKTYHKKEEQRKAQEAMHKLAPARSLSMNELLRELDQFNAKRRQMGLAVPFPVSWTVKMKKKQKETQDILSYHTQAAGCSDKARAKASGGRQPIEECGRTGL